MARRDLLADGTSDGRVVAGEISKASAKSRARELRHSPRVRARIEEITKTLPPDALPPSAPALTALQEAYARHFAVTRVPRLAYERARAEVRPDLAPATVSQAHQNGRALHLQPKVRARVAELIASAPAPLTALQASYAKHFVAIGIKSQAYQRARSEVHPHLPPATARQASEGAKALHPRVAGRILELQASGAVAPEASAPNTSPQRADSFPAPCEHDRARPGIEQATGARLLRAIDALRAEVVANLEYKDDPTCCDHSPTA